MLFPCEGVCTVFLGIVFPVVGGFTSTFLGTFVSKNTGLAPFPAVLKASRTGTLNSLNILPYSILFINSFSWILYSFVVLNYYIFFSNIVNFGACLFYVLTCFPLETAARQKLTIRVLVSLAMCVMILSAVCFITFADNEAVKSQLSGWTAVVMLLIFYASPLSTLKTVISSKCSDSIHFFLAVASFMNGKSFTLNPGFLWTMYGIFVENPFIIYPNLLGTLTGVVQIALCFVFPKTTKADDDVRVEMGGKV